MAKIKSEYIKISNLDDFFSFLENIVSRINYDTKLINKCLKTSEFIEKGGVCYHFAAFVTNVLLSNKINAKLARADVFNEIVGGKRYYMTVPVHSKVENHAWVEFEMNGETYVCDPPNWSTHLKDKNQGSKEYKEELEWLKKHTVCKLGQGENPLFHAYLSGLVIKEEPDKNLLLSDLEVEVLK